MLTARSLVTAWDQDLVEQLREYRNRRTAFLALEAEIMASFTATQIMTGYYSLAEKAQGLFGLVESSDNALHSSQYDSVQAEFVALRKEVFGRMAVEMKLLTWRERRRLRKDPTWAIE